MTRQVSNNIRLAVITNVDHDSGIINTSWIDQEGIEGPDIPIPHPFAGKGGEGIYVGPRAGQIVALGMAAYERYIPITIIPSRSMYSDDISSITDIEFDDIGIPQIDDGEVILQGKTGSQIHFTKDGDLIIKNSFGEGSIITDGEGGGSRCIINIGSPVEYSISHSGIKAKGVVRRDVRIEDNDGGFVDFLKDPSSESTLEEVGWNPQKSVTYMTKNVTETGSGEAHGKYLRNPALVEERSIIYEYGKEWNVGTHFEENKRLEHPTVTISEPLQRRERRSNVLSLSLNNPNELIETISGTVVDVFGNILDINRNILSPPSGNGEVFLNDVMEKMRHSIAFHMEINTKKGFAHREEGDVKPLTDSPDFFTAFNNNRDRSKWFINVDKEGLTKINIPATSETGNIPLLTRFENSSTIEIDPEGNIKDTKRANTKKLYRNAKNKDILIDQFGPGGIVIKGYDVDNRLKNKKTSWVEGNQKELATKIEAGTAFHDITRTAEALIKQHINMKAADYLDNVKSGIAAMSNKINVDISDLKNSQTLDEYGFIKDYPNGGGRSTQINMDGSLEMSIGANTIDKVSWILDTAGAIVTRIGRDRQGRSAIIHADGTIAVEVGGYDYIGEDLKNSPDMRFVREGHARNETLPGDPKSFKDGKIVLRIRRANDEKTGPNEDDNFLIIDETGITIKTAGRMNFVSDQDMTFSTDSRILFNAEKVQVYSDNPKFLRRDGRNR